MDTVLEADGVFQLPVGVKQGNAHGHHVLWVWLMVCVALIFFRRRMTSAVMQG